MSSIYYSSCFSLALIKKYFVFYQRVGRGVWRTCPLFCPPPFLERKVSGCQTAKPAGSLFECQNGRRGKGSRKPVIKIPTTLLTASPQPAFISLSGLGGKGRWGRAAWLKTRERNLKLDVEEMSCYRHIDVSNSKTMLTSDLWEFVSHNWETYSGMLDQLLLMLLLMFKMKTRQKINPKNVCWLGPHKIFPFTEEEITSQEKS